MNILNFGSCNIDLVYSVDHIVKVGETEATHCLNTFPGGKGLNQSIALARAGAKVYHAGCVGKDGEILLDVLKENNVNTSYMKRVSEKNGHAIIQVSKKGENSIFLYPGSNEMVDKKYIEDVLEEFEAGDIILLQNEISNVDYIIKKAYEKGMQIVLNPSPVTPQNAKFDLNMISYLILNEVEAEDITGYQQEKKIIDFFKNRYPNLKIILTLGEKGSLFSGSEGVIHQNAFNVDVVDSTAAGDTFTGYFVAGMAAGNDYKSALKAASAAAAISVTKKGAAPSIPEKEEVAVALRDFKIGQSAIPTDSLHRRINEYVDQNIKTATLEELAIALGYSTVYTAVIVKKIEGESFSKLLQRRRCQLAAEMLSSTDVSIGEIINEVGYENESFFRKIFKEIYGKNPLEFRKGKW